MDLLCKAVGKKRNMYRKSKIRQICLPLPIICFLPLISNQSPKVIENCGQEGVRHRRTLISVYVDFVGLFTPYFDLLCALEATAAVSRAPLTI